MFKQIFSATMLSYVIGLGAVQAQTAGGISLKQPLVPRAGTLATWTVQWQYEAPKSDAKLAPDEDRIATTIVTKTNDTYWEQTTLTSGKKYEKWIIEGLQLKSLPGSAAILPVAPPTVTESSPFYSDYSKSDFPELAWIATSNFKGPAKYEGRDALRFEMEGKSAYLAVDTQLPISFKNSEGTRLYVFGKSPAAPLTPPARYQEILKAHKNAVEGLKYRSVPL